MNSILCVVDDIKQAILVVVHEEDQVDTTKQK